MKRILIKLLTLTGLSQMLTSCGQDSAMQKMMEIKNLKDSQIINKTESEWKKQLNDDEYYVLRLKGTERPFSGKFYLHKEKGTYTCKACGNELFTDGMKFDSHCGWPSFDKEIAGGKIKKTVDSSHGMVRTEITCARCGSHLGHLFDDGPTKTGMRYCVNSVSLDFVPTGKEQNAQLKENTTDTLTLGGGCFWCVEAIYRRLKGVEKVVSGYSGGTVKNPSYEEVSNGTTGHAEVVQVIYNNREISVEQLLKVFFSVHDPTTLNRQGADIGTQYRSVIFYHNQEQKQAAEKVIAALNKEKIYTSKIVTELTPFKVFYSAEDYHQDYYENNKSKQYCKIVIQPKVEKFEKVFKDLLVK